jgi:hypothetical protein
MDRNKRKWGIKSVLDRFDTLLTSRGSEYELPMQQAFKPKDRYLKSNA